MDTLVQVFELPQSVRDELLDHEGPVWLIGRPQAGGGEETTCTLQPAPLVGFCKGNPRMACVPVDTETFRRLLHKLNGPPPVDYVDRMSAALESYAAAASTSAGSNSTSTAS